MKCPHCRKSIDQSKLLTAKQDKLGLTNAQVAARLGVTVQRWHNWKNGVRRVSLDKLNAVLAGMLPHK